MKLYIAYGSNLNVDQMRKRCPNATLVETGFLKDWELIYRGSMTGAYATIRRKVGSYVPVGIWHITPDDEQFLDIYEGYPRFYQKYNIDYENSYGKKKKGMIYIMNPTALPGRPSEYYIDTIYFGYKDLNLDFRFLYDSLRLNKLETTT